MDEEGEGSKLPPHPLLEHIVDILRGALRLVKMHTIDPLMGEVGRILEREE